MKRLSGPVFLILCLTMAGLGMWNVFGHPELVEALARKTACESLPARTKAKGKGKAEAKAEADGKATCKTQLRASTRWVVFHEYDLRAGGKPVVIRCQRGLIFLGDWACKIRPPV